MEARRCVLFEHNFFAVISREIEKCHSPVTQTSDHAVITHATPCGSSACRTACATYLGRRVRLPFI